MDENLFRWRRLNIFSVGRSVNRYFWGGINILFREIKIFQIFYLFTECHLFIGDGDVRKGGESSHIHMYPYALFSALNPNNHYNQGIHSTFDYNHFIYSDYLLCTVTASVHIIQ